MLSHIRGVLARVVDERRAGIKQSKQATNPKGTQRSGFNKMVIGVRFQVESKKECHV